MKNPMKQPWKHLINTLVILTLSIISSICLPAVLAGCSGPTNWSGACEMLMHVDAEAGDFAAVAEQTDPDLAAKITEFRDQAAPVIDAVCAIAADPDHAEDPTVALTVALDAAQAWAIDEERMNVVMYIYGVRASLRLLGVSIPAYSPPAESHVHRDPSLLFAPSRICPRAYDIYVADAVSRGSRAGPSVTLGSEDSWGKFLRGP